MSIGESVLLLPKSRISIHSIINTDQNSIDDYVALQHQTADIYQTTIGDFGVEFSTEFKELQEMLIAIYTTTKLLGYNTFIDGSETALRFNMGESGLTTITLKEKSNRTILKIYMRDPDSSNKPIMDTHMSVGHESKLKILRDILNKL